MKRESILRSSKGMTLIEIIAVVVLIGIIMAIVAKGVFPKAAVAKAKLNEAKMESLVGLLETYHLQHNQYPAKLEDLIAEVGARKEDFDDLWGSNHEQFAYQTSGNNRTYTLSTYGKDGMPGGEGADKDISLGTEGK